MSKESEMLHANGNACTKFAENSRENSEKLKPGTWNKRKSYSPLQKKDPSLG